MSYFPLDRDILTSSIWALGSPQALKVWLYLMLSANPRTGVVVDTVPSIAQKCGLPLPEVEEALKYFESPDPYSRTPDREGRRIERVPGGGIRLLNHAKHAAKDHSTGRVRAFRERQAAAGADTGGEGRPTDPPAAAGGAEDTPETPFHETVKRSDETAGNAGNDGNRNGHGNGQRTTEAAAAVEAAREPDSPSAEPRAPSPGPVEPACPRCGVTGQLRRERGRYVNPRTGGKGWVCAVGPERLGCGAEFPRDEPAIVQQLAPHVGAALDRERQVEQTASARGQGDRQRVDELAGEFVDHAERARDPAAAELWQRVLSAVESGGQVSRHARATWLRPTEGALREGPRLVVAVPTGDFAEWIPRNYGEAVERAAAAVEPGLELAWRTRGELALEAFDAWARVRKLAGAQRLAVLQAVQRRLGAGATDAVAAAG